MQRKCRVYYPAQGPKTRFCRNDDGDEDEQDACKCKPKPGCSECAGTGIGSTGRAPDSTAITPSAAVVVGRRPQPQCKQKCGKGARCGSGPAVTLVGTFDEDNEDKFSPLALPLLSSKSYSGLPSACRAWPSGTTRRLLALFKGEGSWPPDPGPDPDPDPPVLGCTIRVGPMSSRHLRKQLLKSRGMPSSTTVETGTKGRSSMPAARMAYS